MTEPQNQTVPVSVIRIREKKTKSACLARKEAPTHRGKDEEEDEAGYSQVGPSEEHVDEE